MESLFDGRGLAGSLLGVKRLKGLGRLSSRILWYEGPRGMDSVGVRVQGLNTCLRCGQRFDRV